MPSSITHQLIAEEAIKRLPEKLQKIIENSPDEFFLGAQGPDVFFFYRIGCRSEYNLGKFMHRYRVYDIFSFFLNALREDTLPRFTPASREKALSYILGFISHYCADSTFHPFVYNYLDEHKCEKRVHQLIENDWDVYFARELRGKSVEKYSFPFSAKEIVEDGSIARLYGCLARVLGREDIEKHKFDNGVKNFQTYLKFFHGKCYGAQKSWDGLEKLFHAKPLLGALYPRENLEPTFLESDEFFELSEGRGKSADELFERAVSESARLIEIFLECAENKTELPKEEFCNGLLTGKPLE